MIKEYGNKLQTHNVIPSRDLVAEAWMKYRNFFSILCICGFICLQKVARAPLIHNVPTERRIRGGKLQVRSRLRKGFNFP